MGLYLMLAGTSSKNREKSLEQSFNRDDLKPFLPNETYKKLNSHFDKNDSIYIWGANEGSISQLENVEEGEYVLDVKNKEVPNVFQFCFWYKTPHTNLQEYIGWDEEKPIDDKRTYRYVYFLKNPQTPSHDTKAYYGKAFGHEGNPYWLMGQRYVDDKELNKAINKTSSKSVEEFLGVEAGSQKVRKKTPKAAETKTEYQKTNTPQKPITSKKSFIKRLWEWVKAFPGFNNS